MRKAKAGGWVAGALLAAVGAWSAAAQAASSEVGPTDDVESAINALQPGDELVLQGGDYTLTDAWHLSVAGTDVNPIVIRAKDGEVPNLNRPAIDQNIIDFDDVQHLEIRGIHFSGGSAGLRFITANFVTVEDCEVFNTADVAITANSGSDYEGLRFIHNDLHDTGGTGEGMYIGCNDNGCQVHDSLFEGNHIHHTNGASVTQGDGIEIKEGSYNNIVRDNVIHDTGYPCIITYSTVGNGGPNVIERNLLWNCGDHGIQSAADVIIRNNIILGAVGNGIANQPHQAGTPANIQILFNTIFSPNNDAISSTGITGSVLIANNAVYSAQGNAIRVSGDLAALKVAGNVGEGSLSGVLTGLSIGDLANDFIAASYSGVLPNDVFPAVGSALIGAGDTQHTVIDDFNGTLRDGTVDVGAYVHAAMNPGSPLSADFKPATQDPPPAVGPDGGSTTPPADAGAGGTSSNPGGNTAGNTTTAGAGTAGRANSAAGNSGSNNAGTGSTIGPTTSSGGSPTSGAADSSGAGDSAGCGCAVTKPRSIACWWSLAVGFVLFARRREGKS